MKKSQQEIKENSIDKILNTIDTLELINKQNEVNNEIMNDCKLSHLGYGLLGDQKRIPSRSTLIYNVEVTNIIEQ